MGTINVYSNIVVEETSHLASVAAAAYGLPHVLDGKTQVYTGEVGSNLLPSENISLPVLAAKIEFIGS